MIEHHNPPRDRIGIVVEVTLQFMALAGGEGEGFCFQPRKIRSGIVKSGAGVVAAAQEVIAEGAYDLLFKNHVYASFLWGIFWIQPMIWPERMTVSRE